MAIIPIHIADSDIDRLEKFLKKTDENAYDQKLNPDPTRLERAQMAITFILKSGVKRSEDKERAKLAAQSGEDIDIF